jgi:hypothetical protein
MRWGDPWERSGSVVLLQNVLVQDVWSLEEVSNSQVTGTGLLSITVTSFLIVTVM